MIRIVLLEDHAIVREGVRFLLDQESEFSVIAEFDCPEQLFAAIPELDADILITDLDFEKYKGVEILQHPAAITSMPSAATPTRRPAWPPGSSPAN